MKCTNCGTEFEDGKLFCPVCGHEVQWVPEYNTVETIIQQKEMAEKEKREKKERERKKREAQALKEKKRQEMEAKRKRKKFISAAITACLIAGIAIAAGTAIYQKQNNSFDFQMAQAESEFSNKNYESAMEYLDRALSLQPDSIEAHILQAKIFIKNEDTDSALEILQNAIEKAPDSISAYGELLRLYEKEDEVDKIKELMDACENEHVKERYSEYICSLPVISLDSGVYENEERIDFSAMDEKTEVYYTINGKTPDQYSLRYDSNTGILLEKEGEYDLKYIAYNEKGIPSDIGKMSYTIEFKTPDAPQISPDSGQYEGEQTIKIQVPAGCKAYYAFNEPPTVESTQYTGPVTMPVGENIFSAIIVGENGKISATASATYVIYQ